MKKKTSKTIFDIQPRSALPLLVQSLCLRNGRPADAGFSGIERACLRKERSADSNSTIPGSPMRRLSFTLSIGVVSLLTILSGCGSPSSIENSASADSSSLQSKQSGSTKTPPELNRPIREAPEVVPQNDSVSLIGTIVSPKQAAISARIPQRITEVLVHDGQSVDIGQSLVLLDESDFVSQESAANAALGTAKTQRERAKAGKEAQRVKADAEVKSARNGLSNAKFKLSLATLGRQAAEDDQRAELKAANASVAKAELALERSKKVLTDLEELSKAGGVSRSNLEEARTQMTNAQLDVKASKNQVLKLESGQNGIPYRVLNAQKEVEAAVAGVIQAKDGVSSAEKGLTNSLIVATMEFKTANSGVLQAESGLRAAHAARRQCRLLSPISGIVTNLSAHKGETAQPGVSLLSVVSLNDLHAEALVSARLFPAVIVGKAANILVDTLPGKSFTAVVSVIAQTAEPDGRTFRVKFRFSTPPALRPGQTARITIKAGK